MDAILKEYGEHFIGTEYIECSHNAQMLLVRDCCPKYFEATEHFLKGKKWEYQANHQEAGNLYATYTKGEKIISLSYTPFENALRLILDKDNVLPPGRENLSADSVAVPLLTQIRLSYFTYDCGMAYIIRLGDGRFFLIDGGMGEEGEAERMYELLLEQNVLPGKPRIAGWFFSHAHEDHYNGFLRMMELYGDYIDVEMLIYDWLKEGLSDNFSANLTEFDALAQKLREEKGVKLQHCRSGQQFWYQNVVFDVLFTPEDLYPDRFQSVNSSSVVLRMTVFDMEQMRDRDTESPLDTGNVGYRRVMWMGDTEAQNSDYMYAKYPASSWNSEIMQVGHHGYWGTSNELSALIDPKVLLWPCPSYRLGDVTTWDCNGFINHSEKVEHIFCEGLEETVIDLTKKIEESKAFQEPKDGTFYQEEFITAKNTYDLHWSGIVGGQTGYVPVTLTIPNPGVCKLRCGEKERKSVPPHRASETRCGLEMIRAERMQGHDSYLFTLEGKIDHCLKIGLIWNDAFPTVYAEEKVWWLPVTQGPISVILKADSAVGLATLCCNGESVGEKQYVPAERHGMFLILFDGEMEIYKMRAEDISAMSGC